MSRASIYAIREKIILNNITRVMAKFITNPQTKEIRRFHQDISTLRSDGPLTYYLYITIQNLIHLNVIYILFYHTIFWLHSTEYVGESVHIVEELEHTEYEQTLFVAIENNPADIVKPTINVHSINKYVYFTLIGVGTIESIAAFLWALQKKLSFPKQRYSKWRNRLKLLIIRVIPLVYFTFIVWLFFHTFMTGRLTLLIFSIVVIHFILLTILDKPYLFRDISIDLCRKLFATSNSTRKQHRHFPSPVLIPSSVTINCLSCRSSPFMQSRKMNSSNNSLFSSIRWSSVTDQKLHAHECSTTYADIRAEADDLWAMIVRRMALNSYRTFASFIFFDLIPYKMMGKSFFSD